jgi:Fe-S cluster biogenesis protein NfuA
MENADFQRHAEKIEQLVARVTALPDDDARTAALELMQSLMDLHGSALSRTVEVLLESGDSGRNSLAALGADPLICGLLVLYGVHPVPLEQRVAAAIDNLQPQLHKRSGSVELKGINGDTVSLSLQASGNGCHSSPDELKGLVEQAIREAAPEVVEVAIDLPLNAQSAFVPLTTLQAAASEEKKYEESTA